MAAFVCHMATASQSTQVYHAHVLFHSEVSQDEFVDGFMLVDPSVVLLLRSATKVNDYTIDFAWYTDGVPDIRSVHPADFTQDGLVGLCCCRF